MFGQLRLTFVLVAVVLETSDLLPLDMNLRCRLLGLKNGMGLPKI